MMRTGPAAFGWPRQLMFTRPSLASAAVRGILSAADISDRGRKRILDRSSIFEGFREPPFVRVASHRAATRLTSRSSHQLLQNSMGSHDIDRGSEVLQKAIDESAGHTPVDLTFVPLFAPGVSGLPSTNEKCHRSAGGAAAGP